MFFLNLLLLAKHCYKPNPHLCLSHPCFSPEVLTSHRVGPWVAPFSSPANFNQSSCAGGVPGPVWAINGGHGATRPIDGLSKNGMLGVGQTRSTVWDIHIVTE